MNVKNHNLSYSILQLILPEYGLHVFITLLLLGFGYWFTFTWNAPLVGYHVWRSVGSFNCIILQVYNK